MKRLAVPGSATHPASVPKAISKWDLPVPESPIRHSGWPFLTHSQVARVLRMCAARLRHRAAQTCRGGELILAILYRLALQYRSESQYESRADDHDHSNRDQAPLRLTKPVGQPTNPVRTRGELDDDGWMHVVGRIDDVVVSGG